MPTRPPLIGTYEAPAVKRGERVSCLYRDCDCKVTSWSDAPIPWPRVQPIGQRGGCGMWVNDELRRAIRTESAIALKCWFGASAKAVWNWRKEFGVGGRVKTTNGTKQAIRGAAKKGAAVQKAKVWTAAERRTRSRRSKRLGLKPTGRWKGKEWTPAQLALLGTDHDQTIARKIGRTVSAVMSQRTLRKIPASSGWPGGGPAWTAEELALLGTMRDAKLAERIGRTPGSVMQKRVTLKIPPHSGFTGGGRAWTQTEVALLGTDHDEVIAKQLGRTPVACARQRSLRDIPAYSGRVGGGRAWTNTQLALLGTDTDEAISKKINRMPSAVMQKRTALKIAVFRETSRG